MWWIVKMSVREREGKRSQPEAWEIDFDIDIVWLTSGGNSDIDDMPKSEAKMIHESHKVPHRLNSQITKAVETFVDAQLVGLLLVYVLIKL